MVGSSIAKETHLEYIIHSHESLDKIVPLPTMELASTGSAISPQPENTNLESIHRNVRTKENIPRS